MLILRRRVGEAIILSGDIRIVVMEVKGGVVRLGFEAPDAVKINREEIVKPDVVKG